jgi:hypothetical protein
VGNKPQMLVRREHRDGAQIIVGVPVRGEVFELGQGRIEDGFHWTDVENCVLNLHSKRVLASNVTFRNCEIVAKKTIRDMNWSGILFERCTFRGVLKHLNLGIAATDSDHPAGLVSCDLSHARLDYCVFGPIDRATTRWPESRHVIFFHPGSHSDEIRSIVPERPMQGLLQMTAFYNDKCHAVAHSLPYVQEYLDERKWKDRDSAEQLDRFLAKCRTLDFVRINF